MDYTIIYTNVSCPTCKLGFMVFSNHYPPLKEEVEKEYKKHKEECDKEQSKIRFKKVY